MNLINKIVEAHVAATNSGDPFSSSSYLKES
jgi:hypothetical protein